MFTKKCSKCSKVFSHENENMVSRILKMHMTRMHTNEKMLDSPQPTTSDYPNEKLSTKELEFLLEQEKKKNKLLNEIVTRLLMEL